MEGIEVAQICAGAKHSAAISTEGRVYTWGDKIHAQPEPVLALDDVGVTQVACGFKYTAAVDANGDLHTWGSVGWFGQSALGHAAKSSMRDPSRLATLEEAGVRVTHVAAGSSHCAAVAAPR
jgi:alpha-tubulin suppressor-like RCC1 family protein